MSEMGGKRTLRWFLPPEDDRGSKQRERGAAHVPPVRPHGLEQPEPDKRGQDVDATISRVCAARVFGVNECKQTLAYALVGADGGKQVLARPTRRSFVGGAFLATAAIAMTASCSHQLATARVPRIGYLIGPFPTMDAGFRGELARLRYVQGQNLVIETGAAGDAG